MQRTCQRIAGGQAGLNSSFPPTPADIAERARSYDEATADRVPQYNGLVDMDWGHGRVDLRGLTNAEQDAIIRNHGMIGVGEKARNAALMSLDEKIAALREAKQLMPPSPPLAPAVERKPWLEDDGWVEWSPEWGDFPPIAREASVWVWVAGEGEPGIEATGPRLFNDEPKAANMFAWWSRVPDIRITHYKLDRRGIPNA